MKERKRKRERERERAREDSRKCSGQQAEGMEQIKSASMTESDFMRRWTLTGEVVSRVELSLPKPNQFHGSGMDL